MMSCPLSLPLPLLPPDLHADYPPVHIGIKVRHTLYNKMIDNFAVCKMGTESDSPMKIIARPPLRSHREGSHLYLFLM